MKNERRGSTWAVAFGLTLAAAAAACCKDRDEGKPAGLPPLSSAPVATIVAPVPVPAPAPAITPIQTIDDRAQAEALERPPGPRESISGVIVLPAMNKGRVARGDNMFLVARRSDGPPGPASMLAVQRLAADDFPMKFTISSRDSMIPGVPFTGPVSITVRVDKDGDAMTRMKGDVYGQVRNVSVGNQKVTISLDTVQEQDQTLPGGPGPMEGAMPPNHP